MPKIDLKSLRTLRRRAHELLQTLQSELEPFLHDDKERGFVRTPESDSAPDDVNVTTTCSCLMALALTRKMGEFYGENYKETASKVFNSLLTAPWMSSGLTENNAFTTTLILRTFGFLVEVDVLPSSFGQKSDQKLWEHRLEIKDVKSLARRLMEAGDPFSKCLSDLMDRNVRTLLTNIPRTSAKIEEVLSEELGRIARTSHLYKAAVDAGFALSQPTKEASERGPDAYHNAHLNRLLLGDCYKTEIKPIKKCSLKEIAKSMSSSVERFGINKYNPAATVVYWFVDGVDRAQIQLPHQNWDKLCLWAAEEFTRQRSLVTAKHAAMMDPIAMAMAACLCARLKAISDRTDPRGGMTLQTKLPSSVELEKAALELFREQTQSGIWPKYFPLFHYQEAGSNFCFTFELLEAVLNEFGTTKLLEQRVFISGLERAVDWCEQNRLHFIGNKSRKFGGWNSGGFIKTIRKGMPESWATAVVHMFLWELVEVLSQHIQEHLLDKYEATRPMQNWKRFGDLLDIEVFLKDQHISLHKTLSETIVASFESFRGAKNQSLRVDHARPEGAVSALLFGPPGTSKTEVTRAVAAALDWPLVQIDPSHFLRGTLQNIYVQAQEIFEDINDLAGVVVLFDELDALVQKRDDEQTAVDTEAKFLTTYMLPKLAQLHERGRVAFFMATNFQEKFDDAIKRAGRFDLLLCMGPPTLDEKCSKLHVFLGLENATRQTKVTGEAIRGYCQHNDWLHNQLELYTFAEFGTLIRNIGSAQDIGEGVKLPGAVEFERRVRIDCKSVVLRVDDLRQELNDKKFKRLKELDRFDIKFTTADLKKQINRYIRDRKESMRYV